MDMFESLKKDHRKAESLLQDLSDATDADDRASLCAQLTREIEIHTEIEERILYPLLQEYDATRHIVQDGIMEHNSAKEHLRSMAVRMDVGSQDWIGELEVVRAVIAHHVQEEEEKLFPAARGVLTKERIDEVGKRMEELKSRLKGSDLQLGGTTTRQMREAGEKIKGVTQQLAADARVRGKGVVAEQIRHAAEPVHDIARAMHSTADTLESQNSPQLSQYAHLAAERIDDLATRLESADIDDFIGRMTDYARQHPAVFIGGAVAAGFAISRFLKSSEQHVSYYSRER